MLLLKDNPIWSDLSSDVLKIDGLLEETSQRSVTGFLEFDFSEFSAVIFLSEGKILQCARIKDEKVYPVNKPKILEYLKEREAKVGIYKMKKEIVLLECRIMRSEPVFENMSSQYVDAKKLLLTLETEKFSGVVTIRAEQGECFVVLEKGSPAYCLCSNPDRIVDDPECLGKFLEISKENMQITVYRESQKDVVTTLKEVTSSILGERVEKIEEMLETSGKSKEELLKTAEDIERFTYLFVDKKKAKVLSQNLKEKIEEVIP